MIAAPMTVESMSEALEGYHAVAAILRELFDKDVFGTVTWSMNVERGIMWVELRHECDEDEEVCALPVAFAMLPTVEAREQWMRENPSFHHRHDLRAPAA